MSDRLAEMEAHGYVPGTWRTGRKVGRTIYRQHGDEPADTDALIGVMDTVPDARLAAMAPALLAVAKSAKGSYLALRCDEECFAVRTDQDIDRQCTCGGEAVRAALANLEGGAT